MIELKNKCQYNLKICDRANSLLLNYLLDTESKSIKSFQYCVAGCDGIDFINKFSPIEQIFYIAYYIYVNEYFDFEDPLTDSIISYNLMLIEELRPQYEIKYKDKNYIVDYVLDFTRKFTNKDKYFYPEIKNLKYAIELDGYDYHSNKNQMKYDYERENNLKELGFTVIRFTGSQVYKEPYNCIDKLLNIINNDIKKEIKNGN